MCERLSESGPGDPAPHPRALQPRPGQLQGSRNWQKPCGVSPPHCPACHRLLHPRFALWCLDSLTRWSVVLEADVSSRAPDRIWSPRTWGEVLSQLPAPGRRWWSLRGCKGLQRWIPHPSLQLMPGSCLRWAVWEPSTAECAGHGRSVSGGLRACLHAGPRAPGGLLSVHPAPGWSLLPPPVPVMGPRGGLHAAAPPLAGRVAGSPVLLSPPLPPIWGLGPPQPATQREPEPKLPFVGQGEPRATLWVGCRGLRPAGVKVLCFAID